MNIKNIKIENLLLDNNNARFDEDLKIKTADINKSQSNILKILREHFILTDLSDSINSNGFLQTEALIVIPSDIKNKFIVIDGNRRLATIKLLIYSDLAKINNWMITGSDKIKDVKKLPCFVLESKNSAKPLLEIRHIVKVLNWGVYEKATHIYNWFVELPEGKRNGSEIRKFQKELGVGLTDYFHKLLYAYSWLKTFSRDESENCKFTSNIEYHFNRAIMAFGQSSIKQYIGIPAWKDVNYNSILSSDVNHEHYNKIKELYELLANDNIAWSGEFITKHLSKIYINKESIKELKNIMPDFFME